MKTRMTTFGELAPADFDRWRELADNAIEPNAFLDPRFLAPGDRATDDVKSNPVLLVEETGTLHALMPFDVLGRSIRGLRVRAVTPGISFLKHLTPRYFPLVSTARTVEALEALLHGMSRLHLPDYVDFEGFVGEGPLADSLASASAAAGAPLVERGSLDYAFVRRTDEVVPAGNAIAAAPARIAVDHLGSSSRKKFHQYFRGMEQAGDSPILFTDRGDDPHAVEEFLDLQAAGWKGDPAKGGGAFRINGYDRWFVEAAAAFRGDGRLSVFTLTSDDKTVYMQVAIRSGNGMFAAQDAYDEQLAKFRPGNLGRLAVIAHSMTDTRASFFDPNMHPQYVDSTQLYPHRRRYVSYLLTHHGAIAKAVVGSIPLLRRARDRIKPQ